MSHQGTYLIAFIGPIETCPRANRLANSLPVESVQFLGDKGAVSLQPRKGRFYCRAINLLLLLLGRYESYLRRRFAIAQPVASSFQTVVCHDLLLLPALIRDTSYGRLVFDAREYYPLQDEGNLVWRLTFGRLNDYICRTYAHRADSLITVSEGLRREYYSNYGLEMNVVHSYCQYYEAVPGSLGPTIKLVHHGNAAPARKIERLVAMVELLPLNYELHLYLMPKDDDYFASIRNMVARKPRITLHAPVSFDEIVPALNQYDIGILSLPSGFTNFEYAMPNKLFEYVQARLMLLVSPMTDAAAYVRANAVGVVASSGLAKDLAAAIGDVTPAEILRFKNRANELAATDNADRFVAEFYAAMNA